MRMFIGKIAAIVLERVVSGRTRYHELDELLSWTWKAAKDAEATKTG